MHMGPTAAGHCSKSLAQSASQGRHLCQGHHASLRVHGPSQAGTGPGLVDVQQGVHHFLLHRWACCSQGVLAPAQHNTNSKAFSCRVVRRCQLPKWSATAVQLLRRNCSTAREGPTAEARGDTSSCILLVPIQLSLLW